ncbi:RDD family protein [Pseudomonas typographi]|uniref:RDD family protein n=1 Tax=Pseudomonas typographi TaxID=2715964 RepID=UPI001685A1F4|nr:RDD family protein [Pseudomonas typographi]MBD1550926.1 RDD family protein [Pseudomonas typographi]
MLATGPHPPPVDTLMLVETPEGIDLPLRPAGLVPRALAFTADLAIRGVVLLLLALLLHPQGDMGVGALLLAIFLVNGWYMVLFEVLHQGRTPGKQLLRLRVVLDDGTPIGWSASLLRNLLRAADMLPLGYALGITSSLLHPAFKRVGDLAAGTLVVYQDAPPPVLRWPEVAPAPAPFALAASEQRALLELVQRQANLAPARVEELAALLAPALGVPAQQAMARINGIARAWVGPA